MDRNADVPLNWISKSGIKGLKGFLSEEMKMEFDFVDVYGNDVENEILGRMWNMLTFRPDMACKVAELCRNKEVGMSTVSDYLEEAIEEAKWPEDFW